MSYLRKHVYDPSRGHGTAPDHTERNKVITCAFGVKVGDTVAYSWGSPNSRKTVDLKVTKIDHYDNGHFKYYVYELGDMTRTCRNNIVPKGKTE